MNEHVDFALLGLAVNPAAPPDVLARVRRPSETSYLQRQIDTGNGLGVSDLEQYAGPAGLAGLAVHQDPKVRAALGKGWPVPIRICRSR